MTQHRTGSPYIFPRVHTERKRLDDQNTWLIKALYEGRHIYDRDVELGPKSRVLDSGAGTGAWLLGLSSGLSTSAQLFGSDISDCNFPETCPSNVRFLTASSSNLPSEWSGTFDFVHQRLLCGALPAKQWPVVLSEFLRVLKSGGSIQLVETQILDLLDAGPAFTRFQGLLKETAEILGLSIDVAKDLAQMLESAGFVDIKESKKYIAVGKAGGDVGLMGQASLLDGIQNLGPTFVSAGVINNVAECGELRPQVNDEWNDDKVCMHMAHYIVCARKP